MELLNKKEKWFFSEEGTKSFCALSSLEERITFIYSYLKNTKLQSFDNCGILFKVAFFLADSDGAFDKTFAEYPKLINNDVNPFLNYLMKLDFCPFETSLYAVFTAILNKKVDVNDKKCWIYNKTLLNSEELPSELAEMDLAYLPPSDLEMANPELYELDEHTGLLQLKLAWLFLK